MIPIRSSFLVACAVAFGPALAAQTSPLGPRSFAPEDYDGEVVVDVVRLADLGLLADLQRSPLAMLLGKFRDTFGFDLEEVERVRFAIRQGHGEGEERVRGQKMWVFEGGPEVALGKGQLAGEADSVGDVKLLHDEIGAVCSPRPGLVAFEPKQYGSESRMTGLVDGTKKSGVPCAALLEITTKPGVIVSIATVVPPGESLRMPGVGPDWTDAADRITAMALRLNAEPGAGGDALAITAVLRFDVGETGPALFQTRLKAALVEAAAEPKAKPIKGLIEAVTTAVAGRDLVVTLPLGAGRAASGKLAQAVIFLGALVLSPVEAVAEEVVIEAQPEPEPEPAPPPPPVRRR
ncbi:MAG: hypothetical protein HZB39_15965 [Planctomycetes bacterium]|nr:hypothetical protein [Planctomycetota bacterium]